MNDSPQPAVPTKAEMEILRVLWKLGPASVRQIHEAISRETGYTTILKMLQIMTEKGMVSREAEGRAHIYTAAMPQQRATGAFLGDLVERVFGGSAQELVMQALSSQKSSAEELREIRKLIDELEEEGK